MSFNEDLLEVLIRIAVAVETLSSPSVSKPKTDTWRDDTASDKQRALMAKHGIPFTEPITKGQASDLINGYFNNKKRG